MTKLVILPGMDGSGFGHDVFLANLGDEIEVISLRLPVELSGYDDLAQWAINELPQDPFVLLAESFSGPLACMVAKENRPEAIIFAASFVSAPRKIPWVVRKMLARLPFEKLATSRIAEWLMMGRRFSVPERQEFHAAISALAPGTLIGRIQAVLAASQPSRLPCPAYGLIARQDRLLGRRVLRDFRSLAVDLRCVTAPHFALQAAPVECAKAVQQILNEL